MSRSPSGTSVGLGYASGTAPWPSPCTPSRPHLRPPRREAALGLAVFVALAGIHSGAYLPLDVVGGASLGVILGEAFRVIEASFAERRRT